MPDRAIRRVRRERFHHPRVLWFYEVWSPWVGGVETCWSTVRPTHPSHLNSAKHTMIAKSRVDEDDPRVRYLSPWCAACERDSRHDLGCFRVVSMDDDCSDCDFEYGCRAASIAYIRAEPQPDGPSPAPSPLHSGPISMTGQGDRGVNA